MVCYSNESYENFKEFLRSGSITKILKMSWNELIFAPLFNNIQWYSTSQKMKNHSKIIVLCWTRILLNKKHYKKCRNTRCICNNHISFKNVGNTILKKSQICQEWLHTDTHLKIEQNWSLVKMNEKKRNLHLYQF